MLSPTTVSLVLAVCHQPIQWLQCQLDSTGTVNKIGMPTLRIRPNKMMDKIQIHKQAFLQQQDDFDFLILIERPNPSVTSFSVSSKLCKSARYPLDIFPTDQAERLKLNRPLIFRSKLATHLCTFVYSPPYRCNKRLPLCCANKTFVFLYTFLTNNN